MKKVVFPREMAEMDRRTIAGGISGEVLMERAGKACAKIIMEHLSRVERVAVVCGSGNNGGDGFVIARYLIKAGYPVDVFTVSEPEAMSADSRLNAERLMDQKVPLHRIDTDFSAFQRTLVAVDVLVDAVFGTGLKDRPLAPDIEKLLEAMDRFSGLMVAIDIPSGLRGDNGMPLSKAVHADLTITIQNIKTGCLLNEGPDYTKEAICVDIGIEENGLVNTKYLLDEQAGMLPPRIKRSHKYDYGHICIVAGAPGMLGAAVMASEATLKSGAGLVTTSVPQEIYEMMAVKMPSEIMVRSLNLSQPDQIAGGRQPDVILTGPGIGRETDYTPFLEYWLKRDIPLVIDADGLWHLEKIKDVFKKKKAPVIITPHLGEFSHLTGLSKAKIIENPIEIGTAFAQSYQTVLVLKGHRTLVFDPEGNLYFNTTGNPGMATAGSGDVLAGMIAAFLGRGMDGVKAACCGVYRHGKAGDLWAAQYNMDSLTAQSLIDYLKVL